MMIRVAFANSQQGAQSALGLTSVLGSSVALIQVLTPVALGQDSAN